MVAERTEKAAREAARPGKPKESSFKRHPVAEPTLQLRAQLKRFRCADLSDVLAAVGTDTLWKLAQTGMATRAEPRDGTADVGAGPPSKTSPKGLPKLGRGRGAKKVGDTGWRARRLLHSSTRHSKLFLPKGGIFSSGFKKQPPALSPFEELKVSEWFLRGRSSCQSPPPLPSTSGQDQQHQDAAEGCAALFASRRCGECARPQADHQGRLPGCVGGAPAVSCPSSLSSRRCPPPPQSWCEGSHGRPAALLVALPLVALPLVTTLPLGTLALLTTLLR